MLKQRIFRLMERNEENCRAARIFNGLILTLILMSIVVIVLQSFRQIDERYAGWFDGFELFTVIIFTLEYLLRIWVADMKYRSGHPGRDRIRHIFSGMALIDLAAILPFFLPMFLPFDLRFIRILRLTRLLRILKLNRYSRALTTIGNVIRSRKDELVSSLFIMGLVLLIASVLMYYAENGAQPEIFSDIIASLWWAICTLTTVGYGDLYPVTAFGKFIASIITVLGIGIIALPTAIISSGFLEVMRKKEDKICPHCGKKIDE